MCQFIETIKVNDGIVHYLEWHQKRMDLTFAKFFSSSSSWPLNQILNSISLPNEGLYKLRMVYDDKEYQISVHPYQRKTVNTFEFKEINFSYNFKFLDRSNIDKVVESSRADEVIFTRHGQLLDASYANIALYDGEIWWTPTSHLLNGTTRQRLLKNQTIREKEILQNDIKSYKKISFINALNDLDERSMWLSS